jgi:hypothetical protein
MCRKVAVLGNSPADEDDRIFREFLENQSRGHRVTRHPHTDIGIRIL